MNQSQFNLPWDPLYQEFRILSSAKFKSSGLKKYPFSEIPRVLRSKYYSTATNPNTKFWPARAGLYFVIKNIKRIKLDKKNLIIRIRYNLYPILWFFSSTSRFIATVCHTKKWQSKDDKKSNLNYLKNFSWKNRNQSCNCKWYFK